MGLCLIHPPPPSPAEDFFVTMHRAELAAWDDAFRRATGLRIQDGPELIVWPAPSLPMEPGEMIALPDGADFIVDFVIQFD
jgi:hypothetical protein